MKSTTDKHLTRGIAWFMAVWLSVGWQWQSLFPIQPVRAAGEKMILLWDTALGGTVPTGWTNASATYGNYFLRGDSVANVGVTNIGTHTHTSGTVAFVDASTPTVNSTSNKTTTTLADAPHGHAVSGFNIDPATILPVYRNLIAITYDSGIPTSLPQYAIVIFDSGVAATGFSDYTAQDGNMIRISATSGGTGGATTHTHANFSILSGTASATVQRKSGAGVTALIDHTHSYGPTTSPVSSDNTPLHTEVDLRYVTSSGGTAIPNGMIAMFNGDPNIDSSGWDVISDSSEAFGGVYIEAQTTYQTGQGNASHNHALSVTSSTATAATPMSNANPVAASIDTHSHTISGDFSTENNTPPYINVVVGKKQALLGITAPTDVTLNSGNPGKTTETTWGTGEKVIVTDGGVGWSLTVIMTVTLNDGGGHTIPNANVKLRTDGIPPTGGSDTYTIWSGTFTNVTEPGSPFIYSLDTSRTVGTRSSGTSGDTSEVRPTIQVVIPPANPAADYGGTMQFTVV